MPPCKTFRSLQCLFEFEVMEEKILSCRSPQELKALPSEVKHLKAALNDLTTMAKSAQKRLLSQIAASKNMHKSSKEKTDAANKKSKQVKKVVALDIFELASNHCIPVPTVPWPAAEEEEKPVLKKEDLEVPVIVHVPLETLSLGKLMETSEQYADQFQTDPQRQAAGRSQKRLNSECEELLRKLLPRVFPPEIVWCPHDCMNKTVSDSIVSSMFAVAKDSETSSAEVAHLMTARLGCVGSRKVMLAPLITLQGFLRRTTSTSMTLPQVYHLFKTMTADQMTAFNSEMLASRQIMHATLGPRDMLVLPPGWIFFERVLKVNYVGIKQRLLSPSDLTPMEEIQKHLTATQKPNETLQAVIDHIRLSID